LNQLSAQRLAKYTHRRKLTVVLVLVEVLVLVSVVVMVFLNVIA
jgi:F0F1-type ATP synthase membrane subunit c/vacuolar-type H+-ATPase subunit K